MLDEDVALQPDEDNPHARRSWRPAPYDSTGFGNALLCFVSVVCACAIAIDCIEAAPAVGLAVSICAGVVGVCMVATIAVVTFRLERRRDAHSRSHVMYPWVATIALFVVWGLVRLVMVLA
ncbi:hypothetical protein I6E29_09470 [Arcanobacterium haemolyticum]|nr:hypothetical protein [Arcanobacterium haemolyticum]